LRASSGGESGEFNQHPRLPLWQKRRCVDHPQSTADSIWSGGPILIVNDITSLLVAFGGHRGVLDGCAHDAMFRMTAFMASGKAGR